MMMTITSQWQHVWHADHMRCPPLQISEGASHLGIDCNQAGTHDMKQQNVFETLVGKQQQLLLATQVTKVRPCKGRLHCSAPEWYLSPGFTT